MIRIIVTGYAALGRTLTPGQRPWWRVNLEDGTLLLERSHQPFFAAARALLARGVDPDERMTMRHAGAAIDSFKPARVGFLAGKTILESDSQSIRLVKWQERPEFHRSVAGVQILAGSEVSGVGKGLDGDED